MSTEEFLLKIKSKLEKASNSEDSRYMEAYLKHKFKFYGVKAPHRKMIFKKYWPSLKNRPLDELLGIVEELWTLPEREYQYAAMDILYKVYKKMDQNHLPLVEDLILSKSWWDTVDFLAARVVGKIIAQTPAIAHTKVDDWILSGELWMCRTALLFQLFYKEKTNFSLMSEVINKLKTEDNFFIRKGIGWALRQYSKVDSKSVQKFLNTTEGLSNLSIREASKYL